MRGECRIERVCRICGKPFIAKSSRRSFCYEDHYHPCPVCGKPVLTRDLQHLEECCCPEHSRQKSLNSIKERFDEWPSNTEAARAKRKQTNLERFGVDNPAKNPEIKERISEGLHKRYAIDLDDIMKRARQTYFERTGYYYCMQNPEVVQRIKDKNMAKYGYECIFQSPEYQKRIDQTNLEKYGSTIPMQNHEVWAKQRSKKSQFVGCDGTKLDSTYEVAVYDYCIRNGIPIQRTYPIPYEYEGKMHKTFIDFVIDGMLVEVKGEHALEGYYDSQPDAVPIAKKLEVYRANDVIVVTGNMVSNVFSEPHGLYYKDKFPNQLIGVDIELFRNPEFPYAANRPECFYHVEVDGNKSAYDAFYDERIRWKMIKNRVKYMGGFISSKQILVALNVTKCCKQPSWFAKSYAEYLIKKYSESKVIVDPFAGWGTRHDAAVGLHRTYIGIDSNSELVDWHKENNRNISLGDASNFKYDGECDVLMCPPYLNTEVYFKGQKQDLTQCEWLAIVMHNIPNARRYIMVCRDVDEGYEQYVVERKENRSHFGVNYESVLVVDNQHN